jgi:uncharacterized surface protein with fasciclin (FAS1) repeats
MRLRTRLAAAIAGTALVAGAALAGAPAANALSTEETNDFLGQLTATYNDPTVSSDGNPYDFDIVTKAVLVTGADGVLASLDNFTLFAPNDRAFEQTALRLGLLPKGYKVGAKVNETVVFNAVAGLGIPTVTNILLYHVVPGKPVLGADAVKLPIFGTKLTTALPGQKLGVTNLTRIFRTPTLILTDNDGRLVNDFVVKSKIDVVKTPNVVVHGISDVLLPKL